MKRLIRFDIKVEKVHNKTITGYINAKELVSVSLKHLSLGKARFEISPTSIRISGVNQHVVPKEIAENIERIKVGLKMYYDGYYKNKKSYFWLKREGGERC